MTTEEPRARSMAEAIRIARDNVRFVKTTPNGYEVHAYCPKRHAFIAGPPQPYAKALADTAQARHAEALIALGWSPDDAWAEAFGVAFGSLRQRVRASIKNI